MTTRSDVGAGVVLLCLVVVGWLWVTASFSIVAGLAIVLLLLGPFLILLHLLRTTRSKNDGADR